MHFHRSSSALPCWARDTCLLKQEVRRGVVSLVKSLNKAEKITSPWYNASSTTIDRAEIIIRSIALHSQRDWNSKNLDEFVACLSEIFWPNKLFDHRARIFVADLYADNQHSKNDTGGSTYCQRLAYNNCAIQLLAGVLGNIEKRHDERHSLSREGKQLTWSRSITRTKNLPSWIRYPEMLDLHLSDSVVELIKTEVRYEPTWRLDLTTEERARIILAHIQRRFQGRVKTAVEKRRPMSALWQIFDMKFAENLRSTLSAELKARYHLHPSSWSQTCGIWSVVYRVLLEVLLESERRSQRPTHKSIMNELRDRLYGILRSRTMLSNSLSESLEKPLLISLH